MFDIMNVAKIIKEARISQNMTQMDLADAMEVSYQAVSNWERGNSMPDIAKLEQLCQVLKISLDQLLGTQKEAETIAKIIDDDEISPSAITMDVLKELAPLLPPQDVKKFVNYQIEKTEDPQAGKDSENRKESKIDYYTIIGLAPFLSQADLDELIARLEGDISPEALIALAPFLSRRSVDELATHLTEGDIKPDTLIALAPFLSGRSVDELAMHLTGNVEIELMMGIMPFLSQDGRNKFWKKYGARKE